MATPSSTSHSINIDSSVLRAWPLPMPSHEGDKEARGHVLIIGGSREMPGAIILAATAAMRAGAGKLTIATGASVAQLVALAIPEARVIGLGETAEGGFTQNALDELDPLADKVNAVLIGPGMKDEAATAALVRALLPRLEGGAVSVVLDACAMGIIVDADKLQPASQAQAAARPTFRFNLPVIVTPHAGEMAHLSARSKDDVLADPDQCALSAARDWNAVVALKGARTVVGAPDGSRWQHEGGNLGLASSGSGDTLAGIIAGLAARGATLEQATCWGIALHARAGERLAERFGNIGYLARELPHEIPALMTELGSDQPK